MSRLWLLTRQRPANPATGDRAFRNGGGRISQTYESQGLRNSGCTGRGRCLGRERRCAINSRDLSGDDDPARGFDHDAGAGQARGGDDTERVGHRQGQRDQKRPAGRTACFCPWSPGPSLSTTRRRRPSRPTSTSTASARAAGSSRSSSPSAAMETASTASRSIPITRRTASSTRRTWKIPASRRRAGRRTRCFRGCRRRATRRPRRSRRLDR